jgi:hypothetical protein
LASKTACTVDSWKPLESVAKKWGVAEGVTPGRSVAVDVGGFVIAFVLHAVDSIIASMMIVVKQICFRADELCIADGS